MSSIVVAGDTSGSITLQAPVVAGSSVLTLPVATDTLVGKATTDTLTNKTLTSPVIAGTPTGVGVLTSGTAVASTSGTSIDFTGIPSWVKRITVMFNGVSTSITSNILIQLGSTTFTTSGYAGQASSGSGAAYNSAGFTLTSSITAASTLNGIATIANVSGNIWVEAGTLGNTATNAVNVSGGSVSLAGILDRVRITTVNGTDTFDAGSINIMYE